jgi:hypothetical protein
MKLFGIHLEAVKCIRTLLREFFLVIGYYTFIYLSNIHLKQQCPTFLFTGEIFGLKNVGGHFFEGAKPDCC